MFLKCVILQPAAILGFAGLAAFVHYNDERRVVPKGTFYMSYYYQLTVCNGSGILFARKYFSLQHFVLIGFKRKLISSWFLRWRYLMFWFLVMHVKGKIL